MPPAFAAYIAPAAPKSELWRTALGVVLACLVYFGLLLVYVPAVLIAMGANPQSLEIITQIERGTTPTDALILLFSFVCMGLAVWLITLVLHKRGLRSLVGRGSILRNFVICAGISTGVFTILSLVMGNGFTPQENLPLNTWLRILPVALLAVLVQTGAEELAFRGYLQQQLAARLPYRAAWLILPSLLFGMAHFNPEAEGNALLIVAATGVFGLVAADLTARTGNLGAAWGLHFVNNIAALLFAGIEDQLNGLSLYTIPLALNDSEILPFLLIRDMVTMVIVWALCRLALRR
jgi:membrane protease YdiL (CAAX protease family)